MEPLPNDLYPDATQEFKKLLDLTPDDVHVPGATAPQKKPHQTMSEISTTSRKALPKGKFADPANRAYPIHDAPHVRNAAARLEQQKGTMPAAKYRAIRSRIARAAKKFGIDSEYNHRAPRQKASGRFKLSISHPQHGNLEFATMAGDRDFHGPCVELTQLSAKDEKQPVWNQIAKPGRYFKDGFFELSQQTFREIVANFNASENKRVPVDFEHASEASATSGSIPMIGAPAHGWITKLELRSDGNLYGLIEWDGLATDYIKGQNYRFLSPAVRFHWKDPTDGHDRGARLTSAALTNIPFLDGMRPLAAKDTTMQAINGDDPGKVLSAQETKDLAISMAKHAEVATPRQAVELKGAMAYSAAEYMPALRACLGLSPIATCDMCSEHMGMLRDHYAASGGDMSHSPTGVKIGDYMMPLRDLMRAPMSSSWDDVFDMVEDLIDAAIDQHEIEYHAGEQPADAEATLTATDAAQTAANHEDITMSDNKNTAPATFTMADKEAFDVQLKDVKETLAKAQSEAVALSFKLKDSDAQLTKALADRDLEVAKVTALEVKLKEQGDKQLSDRVDNAILSYRDSKGIKAEDKPGLMAFAKADAVAFDRLYPAVAPAQQHLLRDIAVNTAGNDKTKVVQDAPGTVPDLKTMTDRFVKEGKTLEEAVGLAYEAVTKAIQPNGVAATR